MKWFLFFFAIIFLGTTTLQAQTYSGQPNVAIVGNHNVTIPCGTSCYSASANHTLSGITTAYTIDTIPYITFPTTGTLVSANTDDVWSTLISLPFNFCFFGNTYNSLVIGSNGIISFNAAYAGAYCPWQLNGAGTTALPIPNANLPLNSIMGPYQDIDPALGGNITYSIIGTAPRRIFVVSFNTVPQYSCTTLSSTGQIALYEGTNIIDVYNANKALCTTWNNGNAIEGIQNIDGTIAYAVPGRNNSQWSVTNTTSDGRRFRPSGGNIISEKWHKLQDTITISTSDSALLCPPNNATTQYVVDLRYIQCDTGIKIVSDTISISVTQSAGPDKYLSCPSVVDTVVMSASGTGTWTAVPGNPAPTNIVSPTSPNTVINGFTALGTYYFVWSSIICTDTAAVIVSGHPNAGPDVYTCVNGVATMAAIGTGTWRPVPGNPATTVITNPTANNTTISGFTVGGTYQFVWYVNSCTDTASVIIPNFVSSASEADSVLCKYQTTTLSATAGPSFLGPFSYSWSPSSLVVSPNSATTATVPMTGSANFVVTVTSASGCQLYDTLTLTLAGAAPRVHIVPSNNNVCPGDTVTLNSLVYAENLVSCGLVDTLPDNNILFSAAVNNDTSSTTGGQFGTVVNGSPFSANYVAYRAQYLVTKAEMNAAGLSSGIITDISFFVKQLRSAGGYDGMTVSIGCTNLDSLTGFVTGLQEVYPASQTYPNQGWTPLPFTHFYNWDGSSNIVIQVCYSLAGAASSDDYVSYSTTPYRGSTVYSAAFSGTGCNLPLGGFYSGVLNTRPNIKFGMAAPNVLTYHWGPTTLVCDTCPSTQVIVTHDSTYTLTVNENGCINDTTFKLLINRNIAINAIPDTTLCSNDSVRLNVVLTNPPVNQCVQGYTVSSIPYASIAGSATAVPPSAFVSASGFTYSTDNGTAGPYSIGFNFPFYCQSFNQFYINSNGWITFQNPYPATSLYQEYTAQTLPPAAGDLNPQKVIELMMGDYYLADGFGNGGGNVTYFVTGTAPNRTLVVKFNNMLDVSLAYTTSGEIHLSETSGIIDILITSSSYSGVNHTTGVKDSTGLGTAAPGRNNQPYTVTTREAWRFTPQFGGSVAVNSSVWTPNISLSNDSITSPYAYPSASQTYYVSSTLILNQFTHPTTCVVRDSVRVNIAPFPSIVTATPANICPGDTSQLNVTSPNNIVSYIWTPAAGLSSTTIANPRASVLDTTTFYVTAIDNHGCKTRDTVTVNLYPVVHPTIGPGANICYSDSLLLSLPGSYATYQWYSVDSATGARTPITGATTGNYYAHPSGAYVLKVTTPSNTCPSYTNVVRVDSFHRQPIVVDTSGPTGFCVGGNVILQASQGLTNIQWTPSSYGSQTSFPVTSTGVFSYTGNDVHGCLLYSDTVHVYASPVPNLTFNNYRPRICLGDQDTIVVSSDQPGTVFTWTYNNVQTPGNTIVATNAGMYYVLASLYGCAIEDSSVVINISARPTVTLPADYTACNCSPDSVITPAVSGGTPAYTYLWSDGSTGAVNHDTTLGISSYMVTVTDANGCTAMSNIQKIVMSCPRVDISVLPVSDTIFVADTAKLTATPQVQGNYTYLWTGAVDSSSLSTILSPNSNPTGVIALGPGTDTVYLHVTDPVGCTYTTSQVINVIEFGSFRMATAFTPNGDQRNEHFYPVFNGPNSTAHVTAFRIYNRWGQLVYDNPNAPGWGGDFGGNQQPAETYMYFVTIESPDPNNASKQIQRSVEGTFQLLR